MKSSARWSAFALVCRLGGAGIILGIALIACGCGGGGSTYTPPAPAGTTVSLAIESAPSTIVVNDTAQLTVLNHGVLDTNVSWTVNDTSSGDVQVGRISASGLYTAPSMVPAAPVTVKATSKADPTKSASVQISVLPRLTLSPLSPQLENTATQQFTAQIEGTTNTSLVWTALIGKITQTGLYTAPAHYVGSDTVRVTWAGNPAASFETVVNLYAAPLHVTEVAPAAAVVGQIVTVRGTGFWGNVRVYFPGMSAPLAVTPSVHDTATELTVEVPVGARRGSLYVEQSDGAFPGTLSNTIPFQRLANLRVRAPQNELSSSESVQMQWRVLGPPTTAKVDWNTEAGAIDSDGVFNRPRRGG